MSIFAQAFILDWLYMAEKKFTYQVHLDTAQFKAQAGDMRRAIESAFSPIAASPFASISKEIDLIKKSLQSLSKIDLSTSFDQFSAQLKQAQADAKALDSVLKSLSSAKGFQLPNVAPQIEQMRLQLESISKIDVAKPFTDIKSQIAKINSTPFNIKIGIDTSTIINQSADIRKALQSAFAGIDKGALPTGTMIPELQQVKSLLDQVGKTDIARVFIAMQAQVDQVLAGMLMLERTVQNAFTVKGNPLTDSIAPQISAVKQQLESINQVDVTQSIDDIKVQLGELKTVLSGISLSSRFRTPPKFEERINTLKRNLESLNDISINIPNPVENLKKWVIEAREEIGKLKTDLNNILPVGKGKKKTDELINSSALKAELQSLAQMDISKHIVDFRSQIAQAIADLEKLRSGQSSVNATSQSAVGSNISKTFTGFTDLSNPTMQRKVVGMEVDTAQVKQQISAISSLDISQPFDDMRKSISMAKSDVAQFHSELNKIQQPKASMSLSSLGGGEPPETPKRGRTKKVVEDTTSADISALQAQFNEVKTKLDELSGIVNSLSGVNIGNAAEITEKVKAAKKNLEQITKLLTDLAGVTIDVDLSPLLNQVKKVNLDLTKIGQFSELAKLNPSGDMDKIKVKIDQIKAQLANVDNALQGLSGVTINADLTNLVNSVRAMRRNIAYLSGIAENLSNIGTVADFTPLNAKVEQLRQSLIRVGQIVSGLSGAAPQSDLSDVIGKVNKVKDDLGAIGRAAAELVNTPVDANSATGAAAQVAKLDALKLPLGNLSKSLAELSKIKVDKDISTLVADLTKAAPTIQNLSVAVGNIANVTISNDLSDFSAKIETVKANLATIKQSVTQLAGFTFSVDVSPLKTQIDNLRTPLLEIANSVGSLSSVNIAGDTTKIAEITAKLPLLREPLLQLAKATTDFAAGLEFKSISGLTTKLTSASESLVVIGQAVSQLAGVALPKDAAKLQTIVTKFQDIKTPLSSVGTLLSGLAGISISIPANIPELARQVSAAQEPLNLLSAAITSLNGITVSADTSGLQAKIASVQSAIQSVQQAMSGVAGFSIAVDTTKIDAIKAEIARVQESISSINNVPFSVDTTVLQEKITTVKAALSAIAQSITGIGGFSVSVDTARLKAEIDKIQAPLAEISTITASLSNIDVAADPTKISAIAAKLNAIKPALDNLKTAIDFDKDLTFPAITGFAGKLKVASDNVSIVAQAVNSLNDTAFPKNTTKVDNVNTALSNLKEPIRTLGSLIAEFANIRITGDLQGLATDVSTIREPLARLGDSISSLNGITFTGDATELRGKVERAKTSLTAIGQSITELSGFTISGDVSPLGQKVEQIRKPLTDIALAVNEIVGITLPSDPAKVTDVANSFKALKVPLTAIATAVTTLQGVTITGELSPLATQITQAKVELAAIEKAIVDLVAIARPSNPESISTLAAQFTQVKKPLQDIGKTITDLATVVINGDLSNLSLNAVQARVELGSLRDALNTLSDLTAPQSIAAIPSLFTPSKKPLLDIGRLLPELSAIYVTGDLSNLSMQITQARVELTSLSTALTTLAGVQPPPDANAIIQIIEKFNQAKKPIQDLGKLVEVLSKSAVTGNLSGLASQLTAIKGPLSEIGNALREINGIVSPGEASVIGQLVSQLGGAGKGSVGTIKVPAIPNVEQQQQTETPSKVTVSITDKNVENANKLVESLVQASKAMESLVQWSERELASQRTSIEVERQKAQLRREEARLTEAEVQKERTNAEQQRIQLQLQSGINQAESDRQALVASRLEFEKLVTAEVKRQVDLYHSIKSTNKQGAQAVQNAATQPAQSGAGQPQQTPNVAGQANIVSAVQSATTASTQAISASAAAIANAFTAHGQQIGQAINSSPVVAQLQQQTVALQQQVQNQVASLNQYQGVAQTLQQILTQRANLDTASSGKLLAGKLQSELNFSNLKIVEGGELQNFANNIKTQYQSILAQTANFSKAEKDIAKQNLKEMIAEYQLAYKQRESIISQGANRLRDAYNQDRSNLQANLDANRERLKQQTSQGDRLNTVANIEQIEAELKSLDRVFNNAINEIKNDKEALKREFDEISGIAKLQNLALSNPGKSDPNALANASNNQAQIEKRQQQELAAIRQQEIAALQKNTAVQKAELEKRVNQIRSSITTESGLTKKALDEKRSALQQEINILQQANQRRMAELQQDAQSLRRSRTDQIAPLKKQVASLKQAMDSQVGVEREATEKTIAEITRRVEATRGLYAQQINSVNQSVAGLRQAYQAQIAPLQEQMASLQNAQPRTSPFERLLSVGKGFAAAYATVMGSQQIFRAVADLERYHTQLKRAQVATNVLSGSAEKAASSISSIQSASGNTVDKLTAMQIANQGMALGLANTSAEFGRLTQAARAVALVSPVIHDVQGAITELALASANMSYRRLDQLGLSVTEVKDKMSELRRTMPELNDSQLFYEASVDRLIAKYGDLVTSQAAAATGMERLSVTWRDLASSSGLIGAAIAAATDGTNWTAGQIADFISWLDARTGNDSIEASRKVIDDLIRDNQARASNPNVSTGAMSLGFGLGGGMFMQSTEFSEQSAENIKADAELQILMLKQVQKYANEVQALFDSGAPMASDIKNKIDGIIAKSLGDDIVQPGEISEIVHALEVYKQAADQAFEEGFAQKNAQAFNELIEDAKRFAAEMDNTGEAIAGLDAAGMGGLSDELAKLQAKKFEDGELNDSDLARMDELIAANERMAEMSNFMAEMQQKLGSEFVESDKGAQALLASVTSINAGFATGKLTAMQYEAAIGSARKQLDDMAAGRAMQFSNLLMQIDAGLTALINKDGNSKFYQDQIEQLRKYKEELLTTGTIDPKDAGRATQLAQSARGQGFQPEANFTTTQQELANVDQAYAALIARQYELESARQSGILTEQMYAQAIASVNQEMQNIEINATSDAINSANELSTAILNLDAVSAGGLPGFDAIVGQAISLQEQMYATGFATAEQAAQAEYYAAISSIAADSTGIYAQAVGVLGEQFFANNPALAANLQHIIELQAAHATGAISSEVFAGKLSVLTGELVIIGQQAGLTAAQIQSAFGNAMSMVAGLKSQFGGTVGFMRGAQMGSGLVAADRRNENERVRQEMIKTAKGAGKAFDQAAKATEKVWEDAAKEFEDTLKKIPGLFKTTSVSEEDMKAAKAGTYIDKVDEYVRRLRDEVVNKKDWADVSIGEARAGLERAGLDASGNDEQVLAKFEEAWNNQSLWAAAENIPIFVNEEMVKYQKGLQEKIKTGTQNLLEYFGQVIETETGKKYVVEPGSEADIQKRIDEAVAEATKNSSGGGGGGSAALVEATKATFADTTWMNGAIKVTLDEAKAALQKIGIDLAGKTEDEVIKIFDEMVASGQLFSNKENTGLVDQGVIAKQQEIAEQERIGQQNLQERLTSNAKQQVTGFYTWLDQSLSNTQTQQPAVYGPMPNPNIQGATNIKTNGTVTTADVELNATIKTPEKPIEIDAMIKGLTVPDTAIQSLKDSIGTIIVPVSILANTGETISGMVGNALQGYSERFKGQGAAIAYLIGEGIKGYKFEELDADGNTVSIFKKLSDRISAEAKPKVAVDLSVSDEEIQSIKDSVNTIVVPVSILANTGETVSSAVGTALQGYSERFKGQGAAIASLLSDGIKSYKFEEIDSEGNTVSIFKRLAERIANEVKPTIAIDLHTPAEEIVGTRDYIATLGGFPAVVNVETAIDLTAASEQREQLKRTLAFSINPPLVITEDQTASLKATVEGVVPSIKPVPFIMADYLLGLKAQVESVKPRIAVTPFAPIDYLAGLELQIESISPLVDIAIGSTEEQKALFESGIESISPTVTIDLFVPVEEIVGTRDYIATLGGFPAVVNAKTSINLTVASEQRDQLKRTFAFSISPALIIGEEQKIAFDAELARFAPTVGVLPYAPIDYLIGLKYQIESIKPIVKVEAQLEGVQQQQNQGVADGAVGLFSTEFINSQNQKLSVEMIDNLRMQFSASTVTDTLTAMGDNLMSFMGFGMEDHQFTGVAEGVIADLQAAFGNEAVYSRLFNLGGDLMDAILSGAVARIQESAVGSVIVNNISEAVMTTVTGAASGN